ncbi:MAG: LD-carboxypeptidase [Lentisphaeria bacterium]|nr:LD-carboxypeptidase [Candidatus Neomarinimicrobiota bacterium]MCF7842958.1 LD-carboxypeptidase [Lentisphaeria bacterium]
MKAEFQPTDGSENASGWDRRHFLQTTLLSGLALTVPFRLQGQLFGKKVIRPPRLKPGDTVGLINPAGATFYPDDVVQTEEILAALGLKAKRGKHLLDRYGYLAGTDAARAADMNTFYADDSVNALLAVRGGWGCNRILPLLDYDLIKRHPKIIMGYSDITSLLIAIYAKTGVVTFHGPVGISTWNEYSTDFVKQILFDGKMVTMENPRKIGDNLTQTDDRILTITPGTTKGRLVGGNLSVLTAMLGSDYLPDWKNAILFLEEVGEDIYRVDRMLTQLKLAGVLDQISGFVFGKCSNCDPGEGYGSLTLVDLFNDIIKPLGIPAYYGAMIGHISDKFTVPVGVEVEMDAGKGTLKMLEPAVN